MCVCVHIQRVYVLWSLLDRLSLGPGFMIIFFNIVYPETNAVPGTQKMLNNYLWNKCMNSSEVSSMHAKDSRQWQERINKEHSQGAFFLFCLPIYCSIHSKMSGEFYLFCG